MFLSITSSPTPTSASDQKGCLLMRRSLPSLRQSIQVYVLAREYELSSLEELAKLEIERLGNGLRFSMVLDLVRDAYPDPSADDTWFGDYLESGLKSLLRNTSELLDCAMPNAERKTISVSDLLFKKLVELVCNNEILPRGLDADPQVEPEAPEESAFMMPEPALGSPQEAALDLDDSDFPGICGLETPLESEPSLPETCEQDLPEEVGLKLCAPETDPGARARPRIR